MKIVLTVLLLCLLHNIYSRHFLHHQNNPAFNNWLTPGGAATGNAFNQWLGGGNQPGANPNPNAGAGNNPAFNNWLNKPGQPGQPGQNPAFANWVNNPSGGQPGTGGQNPAFGNWLNNQSGVRPNPQNPAFGNWLNNGGNPGAAGGVNPLTDPSFGNALRGQIGGAGGSNPLTDASFANALRGQIGGAGGAANIQANNNAFIAFLQSNNVPNATQLPTLQQCSKYTIKAGGGALLNNNNYKVTCTLPNGRSYSENCFGQQSCDYLTCKFLKCSQVPGGRVFRVKI